MAIMREAIRSAQRLYSAPVFQDRVHGMVLPGGNVTSDKELDTYIRSVAATFTHGVGSAAMSPRDASWGVVDPDMRVKGTNGLRIVDASIFVSCCTSFARGALFLIIVFTAFCTEWTYAGAGIRNRGACERVDIRCLGIVDNYIING